jgi:TatD DNase family protein
MIIDTHAHTYFDSLASREEDLLADMRAVGVEHVVQIAVDAVTSRTVVAMARRRPGVFHAVVGIHPSDCQRLVDIDGSMSEIRDIALAHRDVVVAIGET